MDFLFWDWLIIDLLVGQAILFFLVFKTRILKKNRTKTVAALLLFSGFTVIFYGSYIEPQIITVNRQEINLANPSRPNGAQADSLKAALISDFHLGPYHGADFVKKVAKKIAEEKPDILVMLGDFVYDSEKQAKALSLLRNLPMAKIAVLGNHDYDLEVKSDSVTIDEVRLTRVIDSLEEGKVNILINQAGEFENKVWFIGLDEYWTNRSDLKAALAEVTNDRPRIVLTHNPDAVNLFAGEKVDLVFAGHTHGGQIRLPFLGPIGRIPTGLGQHFDKGLFEIKGYKTFITSGLGSSGPRARLFNPPEVVILNIKL